MSPFWFFLKRGLFLPVILFAVHFLSFGYAHFALQVQRSLNPWDSSASLSFDIISLYSQYLQSVFSLASSSMPGGTVSISSAVFQALINSLVLFLLAAVLSTALGLLLGLSSVKTEPPSVSRWLTPISTLGLAAPGFFIAALFIAATVYYLLVAGPSARSPLPLSGFGWDEHLVLPLLALIIRPTAQIAQSSAVLLSGELSKQYVVAARSIGNTWSSIRRKHALRNVLAPIVTGISSSFRYLIAELILVEYIFSWPGLGRLLSLTLIPPATATLQGFGSPAVYFLHPELLAAVMTVFALFFFILDTLSTGIARWVDPRIRSREQQVFNG